MTPAVEERTDRPRRRRVRTRTSQPNPDAARGRLRNVYFGGAALWGFLTGTGSILAGLSLVDVTFQPGPTGLVLIVIAALLALIGGFVSATAYRQASKRKR